MLMNRKTNKKEKRKKNIKKKKTEEIGLYQQELKIHHLVKTFLKFFIFHDDPRNIGKY